MGSGDRYVGICKEFGFIEESNSIEAVEKRLKDSAILLLKTVAKDPRLEPSLRLNLPLKYRLLFYVVPFIASLANFFKKFRGNIRFFTDDMARLGSYGKVLS